MYKLNIYIYCKNRTDYPKIKGFIPPGHIWEGCLTSSLPVLRMLIGKNPSFWR